MTKSHELNRKLLGNMMFICLGVMFSNNAESYQPWQSVVETLGFESCYQPGVKNRDLKIHIRDSIKTTNLIN